MAEVQPVNALASVASRAVTSAASSVFSGLPLVLLIACGVSLLGGAGGTIWYRMKWLDAVNEGKQAVLEQIEIDKADNAKAIGLLTNKLNAHERELNYAQSLLANIPKTDACTRDQRINAARDILCHKYPKSEACNRPRPAR